MAAACGRICGLSARLVFNALGARKLQSFYYNRFAKSRGHAYNGATFYSLPGRCSEQPNGKKTDACRRADPGAARHVENEGRAIWPDSQLQGSRGRLAKDGRSPGLP